MVNYLYTLDYHVDFGNANPDQPSTGEGPLEIDSKGDDFVNDEAVPYQPSEGETDQRTASRDEVSENPAATWDPLSFHILMYSLADRMFIEGLKALSRCRVEQELPQRLDARSFPGAVLEIYNSTPAVDRGLRDLVVRMTMDHLTEMRTGKEAAPAALQNGLLESVPQYSYDLLVASIDRTVSDWNRYGLCGRNWSRSSYQY